MRSMACQDLSPPESIRRIPAPPPMPPPRRWSNGGSNGGSVGPSPEKAALWSPPPLPSISDVVNLKLRPVAGSPQREPGGAGTAGKDADSGGSLLRELASLQLRSRSDGAGRTSQVLPMPRIETLTFNFLYCMC